MEDTVLNNTPVRSDGDKKVLIEKRNPYWILVYSNVLKCSNLHLKYFFESYECLFSFVHFILIQAYGEDNYDTLRTMGEALEKKDTGDTTRWQEEM